MAITASQMRKIHVLARDYGLDNDLLHVHVQTVTGKDSLKKLSLPEAVRVIDSLEKRSSDRMTWKQKFLIDKLLKELGWMDCQEKPDYQRLDRFCSKRFGVDSHQWLTRTDASKVIEGLKHMVKQEEARGKNARREVKGPVLGCDQADKSIRQDKSAGDCQGRGELEEI